jgi:hypothetical protein
MHLSVCAPGASPPPLLHDPGAPEETTTALKATAGAGVPPAWRGSADAVHDHTLDLDVELEAVTAAGAHFGPPGYEVSLLYLACLAALVLGGPGPLTIGDLIRKRSRVSASASRPNLTPAA